MTARIKAHTQVSQVLHLEEGCRDMSLNSVLNLSQAAGVVCEDT